jgi:hypothetical protein
MQVFNFKPLKIIYRLSNNKRHINNLNKNHFKNQIKIKIKLKERSLLT